MRAKALAAAAALALAPALAFAQWAGWDYDFDEEKKPWKEIEAKIPSYPADQNLVYLEGGPTNHRFYVDANSISLGEDGVMRYSTVLRASGGATNVTFEGMRCETRERKLYAIGRKDGSWVRARDARWKRIEIGEIMPYHYVLYRDYFCPAKHRPATVRQALDALRRTGAAGRPGEGRDLP